MTVTARGLTQASAVAAVIAGVLFIGVQLGHPHFDAQSIQTTEVKVRDTLKVVMCVLSLAGIAGLYLSQVRRNGVLGLIGWLVLSLGYLLMVGMTFAAAFVLPTIAASDPEYVDDAIAVVTGESPVGDVGAFATVIQLQGAAYLAGGLLLGIALLRARVLARWASALLAVGGVVTVALSVMPDAFYRLLAFPNGIAMIGLGVSLWLSQRETSREPATADDLAPVR
ncbi:hypothetical protein [Nocardioides sp. YIM 152588]|uniref:hypothetical protein n=1 Tax=Nocardioides sp. YIM 152588 TaxID=3158259 RepID=UPI0032E3D244